MPFAKKLGAASVFFGLAAGAAPLLDDGSALVQQRAEGFDLGFGNSVKVCTEKDEEDYQRKMTAYYQAAEDFQNRMAMKAKEQREQKQKELDGNVTLFLQPMLDVLDHTGKYLETECQPTGIKIVKGLLQQLFQGSNLVPDKYRIDVNKTVEAFFKRWETELMIHTRSMLQGGFAQLHKKIEKTMEKYPVGLRAKIYNASFPVKNETELRDYIMFKGLPVLSMEVDPVQRWIGDTIADMPTTPNETTKWATKTLLPRVMEKLPKQCQKGKLISTVTFGSIGGGDVAGAIAKFLEKCQEAIAVQFDLVPELAPMKPERKCQTCLEQYKDAIGNSKNPNSCATHCSSCLMSCIGGVNDQCLKSFTPCFRCHKRKLEALDKCEGTSASAPAAASLGKLMEVFNTASVEKDSVNSLLDQFLDIAAEKMGIPVPTTPAPAEPVSAKKSKKKMFR